MRSIDAVTIVLVDGSRIRTSEVIFDVSKGTCWSWLRFWDEETAKEDSIPASRVKCIIPG